MKMQIKEKKKKTCGSVSAAEKANIWRDNEYGVGNCLNVRGKVRN